MYTLLEFVYLVFTRMPGETVPLVEFVYRMPGETVPLVEFMYRMPGENYCRRLRSSLLCLCDVFRAVVNSLVY